MYRRDDQPSAYILRRSETPIGEAAQVRIDAAAAVLIEARETGQLLTTGTLTQISAFPAGTFAVADFPGLGSVTVHG